MEKNEPFYRVPKRLFGKNRVYSSLSPDAKLLCGILLERHELSKANGWVTENGYPYFYYPIRELAALLGVSGNKVCRLFEELERCSILSRKSEGAGRADMLFLHLFEDLGAFNACLQNELSSDDSNLHIRKRSVSAENLKS